MLSEEVWTLENQNDVPVKIIGKGKRYDFYGVINGQWGNLMAHDPIKERRHPFHCIESEEAIASQKLVLGKNF